MSRLGISKSKPKWRIRDVGVGTDFRIFTFNPKTAYTVSTAAANASPF